MSPAMIDRRVWGRIAPLLAGVAGAVAAVVGALVRGLPVPVAVAGVLLVIGLAATYFAREAPRRGAIFVGVLAAIVVVVIYGG